MEKSSNTFNQSKGEFPPTVINEKMHIGAETKSNLTKQIPTKRPRPANGFLGFCHRHRPIVSRRNKKLENRLVTKILGNWWTSLSPEQRKVYEDRAKEYKAVFMAANPGYKWYTPRESTGNTPVTRQSNRRGRKLETDTTTSSIAITPGKLADESQMGSLSSLMQFTGEQSRKRSQEMVSYIASEHDYLETKSPIINNNTITSVDAQLGQCFLEDCHSQHDAAEENERSKDECNDYFVDRMQQEINYDMGVESFEEKSIVKEEKDGDYLLFKEQEPSSAHKRKSSKPKKNPSAEQKELPECPSFKEFMRLCPTYPYDTYLSKKSELNSAHKRSLQKKRRWEQALMEYKTDDPVVRTEEPPQPRRRRKRKSVAPRANKRLRQSSSPQPTPTGRPSSMEIPRTVEKVTAQQEVYCPCRPPIPQINHLDLLVSAAETLENCCP